MPPRKPTKPKPRVTRRSRPSPAAVPEAPPAALELPLPQAAEPPSRRLPVPPSPRRRSRLPHALGLLATAAAVLGVWRAEPWRVDAAPAPRPVTVAVFPFELRGDTAHAGLARAMGPLLRTVWDHAGTVRVVDVAAALPTLVAESVATLDPATLAGLAARLGAEAYVLGDIEEVAGQLGVQAVYHPGSEAVTRSAAIVGGPEDVFGIVDRLATDLGVVPDGAAPPGLAARTTASHTALSTYLAGEAWLRAGRTAEAVRALSRAAARDSTFALAHLRLAEIRVWSDGAAARRAAARAARFSHRLSPAERLRAEGLTHLVDGDGDGAERRFRDVLLMAPDVPEAWGSLGLTLLRSNPLRGRPVAEARPALAQALRGGGGPREEWRDRLVELAVQARDWAAFDSLVADTVAGTRRALGVRAVATLSRGTAADRVALVRALRRASSTDLEHVGRQVAFLVDHGAAATPVLQLLTERTRPARLRALGHLWLAHLAAGGGRWRAAEAALAEVTRLDRATGLEHRALLAGLPFSLVPRVRVAALRGALVQWDAPPRSRALHAEQRAYHLAQLATRMGDLDVALGYGRMLARQDGAAAAHRLGDDLAAGVRARVAHQRGRALDAEDELRGVRATGVPVELLDAAPIVTLPLERWVRAEVLQAVGRPEAALGWYGSFDGGPAFERVFRAPAAVRRGELFEALGYPTEARRQYARALALWRDADPELTPTIRDLQRRVARLPRGG